MKRLYFLMIPFLIAGCTQAPKTTYTVKPMPESEVAFIKKVNEIDSVYNAQKNDITKAEYLSKGKKEMEAYILKNLDVKDWVVKVSKIETNTDPVDYILFEAFLPVGNWRESKYPEGSFPIFTALINPKKETDLVNKLKVLQDRDEVYISGSIRKNLGGIIITPSVIGINDDNTFSNLALKFDLVDIKKTH